MVNLLSDQIPRALKSLYLLENELRSALISGAIQRKEDAAKHLAEARGHLEDAMRSLRSEAVNTSSPTPADKAAPKKDGDV
jgi:hypothetical protein